MLFTHRRQTLIHYDVDAWEGRAYEYGVEALRQLGVPVEGLRFDSSLVIRGWGWRGRFEGSRGQRYRGLFDKLQLLHPQGERGL